MINQSPGAIFAIGLVTLAGACEGRVLNEPAATGAGAPTAPAPSTNPTTVRDAAVETPPPPSEDGDGGRVGTLLQPPSAEGGSLPGACNDLVAEGPSVLTVFEAGPPPDLGQGGMLVDGVYDLVQDTIYQSEPTTDQYFDRETIRISGGGARLDYATASDGVTITETLAPEGASLNPTTTCPGAQVSVGPYYTASPGQFLVVNGLYVKVFAIRQ